MSNIQTSTNSLANILKQPRLVIAPGVYDMVSAKIADASGFDALYMTGFGVAASHLGLPDAGLATYSDMISRVATIVGGTRKPLIADGDTGYGGLLNVDFTVRGYERAGAQAIQLEDQEFPKKCGHTPGRRVISRDDAAAKIKVAVQARSSSDFLVVARTDARARHGLDEALRRGEAFLQAGADILFIEAPESAEEMATIGRTFAGVPLVANMVEGGRTPILSQSELQELGYRIAIYPVAALLAAAAAIQSVYQHLLRQGSTAGWPGTMFSFDEFNRIIGFERVWEFERQNAQVDD